VAQGALAMDGLASQMMSKKLPVSNLRCFIRGSDLRRAYTRCSFMKFTPLFFVKQQMQIYSIIFLDKQGNTVVQVVESSLIKTLRNGLVSL
jgi:hypothetical protein